jgi:hypothetical protein
MATVVFGSGFRAPDRETRPRTLFVLIARADDGEGTLIGAWHSTDRAALEAIAEARRFAIWDIEESTAELPRLHGDGRDIELHNLSPVYAQLGPRKGMRLADGYVDRLVESGLGTIGDLLGLGPRELRERLGFGHDSLRFAFSGGPNVIEAIEKRVREVMGEITQELDRRIGELFGAARRPPHEKHDFDAGWDEEAA